jgi:O-antigen/teichoic acid export membrane protein
MTGITATARARLLPRDPMQRSALALAVNTVVTSVLGFLYWIVAARYYSPAVVGASAALISAMLLMANIAELNLYNTLIRFLPTAGSRARQYALRAYLTVALTSVVVGLAALPLLGEFELVRDLLAFGPAGVVCLLGAVLVWTLFALQDSAAIGARAATWVPVENGVFGVAKLLLLVAFAGTAPRFGVLSSWLLAMVPVLVLMTALLFWRLLPRHAADPGAGVEQITRRNVLAFLTLDNMALIGATAANYLLPIIVATMAGSVANGYFFVAWSVASALDVALVSVASSLTVEGARQQERLGELVTSLMRRMALLAVPLVAVIVLSAPLILSLYGDAYAANSTDLLRVVALAVLPRIVVVVWMSMNRVRQRLGRILAVQAVLTTSVLGLSVVLVPSSGILAVGVAHLAVQTVLAVALLPGIRKVVLGRPGPRARGRTDAAAPARPIPEPPA